MNVGKFYELFEEHRAAGFPDPEGPTPTATPTITPTPTPSLPPLVAMPGAPDYVKWQIGADVPSEVAEAVVEGTRLTHEYVVSLGLPEIRPDVEIYLHGDLDALASLYARLTGRSVEASREHWRNGFAEAGTVGIPGSWSIVKTSLPSSVESAYLPNLTKISAHELLHAYQNELSGLPASGVPDDEVPFHGPRWATEGIAEFFAYKASDAGGVLSYDTKRANSVSHAKNMEKPLRGMETWEGGLKGYGYDLPLLGAELLASYAGEDALLRFYMLQRPGTTWQEAFETAFGMTVEEFYGLFEEHRAAGFPEPGSPESADGKMSAPGPFAELLQDPGLPSYINWKIQSEVDRAEVEDALLGIKLMYEFGKQLGMPDPEGRIVVYIDNDLERLASYYSELTGSDLESSKKSWEGGGAEAGQGWIMAMVSPPGETFWEPGGLVGPMAHELVHAAFQGGVAGLLTDSTAFEGIVTVPRWLGEGMAVFLSNLALVEHRGIDNSWRPKGQVLAVAAFDLLLQDVETWPSGSVGPDGELDERRAVIACINQCGNVAVELLASRVGLRKLADYYMYVEPWMFPLVSEKDYPRPGWRLAFERAFGMTVEEFYELFEDHRAAGFPDPNRPTPTGPQTVDDYIVWKVGDDVSPSLEAETRETVLAVHDYGVGIGMPRIDRSIAIFLYHDLDSLAAAFEANTGEPTTESWYWPEFSQGKLTILAGRDWIAVTTSATRYQEWSPDTRKRELAGNLFDVYRRALTGIWEGTPRDAVDPEGPQWLRAGSREYLTYQALRAPGPESCDPTRDRYARISESVDTPLSETETSEAFWALENAYGYGFLAVELLAEQAGPESIMGYFASLRTGVTWHEAFESAFGMTVAEFYQLFEERRAAGFPRPRCPTLPPLVTMPGSPEYVKWYIGPDVPPEYVQEILEGTQLMHEYAASRVPLEPGYEIQIFLYGDLDTAASITSMLNGWPIQKAREYWENGFAMTGPPRVANGSSIMTNTFSERYAQTKPKYRMKVAAHELLHAYQTALGGLRHSSSDDQVPRAGPRWLREGIAEFFAYKALDAGSVLSYETERNSTSNHKRFVTQAEGVDRPLSEMEKRDGIRGVPYPFLLLAAELLASRSGEDALIRFFSLGQPGTTWQEAFETAFGMTVEEFYGLFEEHRAAGFPDPEGPTPTATPKPEPVAHPSDILDWFADPPDDKHSFAANSIERMWDLYPDLGVEVARLNWVGDGITWNEEFVLEELSYVVSEDPELVRAAINQEPRSHLLGLGSESARQAADYPWLADGLDARELYAIIEIARIAERNPGFAERVLGYTWLADGITEAEARGLGALSRWALLAPELVDRVLKYTWLDDGITDAENDTLSVLYSFAERGGVEAAAQVMDYQWLADGVTWDEYDLIAELAQLIEDDPEAAIQISRRTLVPYLLGLVSESGEQAADYPWLADGVNARELRTIIEIARIAERNPGFAERVLGYTWLADGITEAEARGLGALSRWALLAPELVDRVLKYTWLGDGITEAEARGLDALSGWALQFPELVDRVLKYTWLGDGITHSEGGVLYALRAFAERGGVEATKQVMDYQWLADGVTWDEHDLIAELESLVADDPEAAIQISRRTLVPYLLGLVSDSARQAADYPWLADGVNARELRTVVGIALIAQKAQELAERLLRYSWLTDGISQRESDGINSLADIARVDLELARQVVGMGILDDPLRDRDLHAITSLRRLVETDDLALLTSQPWFTDGLSDEETAFLVVTNRDQHSDSQYRDFLRTHFTRSATISLPLAGDVDLWVFWHLPFPESDDTVELIEDAVRALEALMGVPFPTTDIILLLGDPDSISYSGYHAGNYIAMDRIVGEGNHRGVVYHETAHYYYMGIHSWFNEGFADLAVTYTMTRVGLRSFAEREDYLEKYDLPECIELGFRNIQELLDKGGHACLGEFILVSLFNLLGEEATSAALRELYLMSGEQGEEDFYLIFLKHTPLGLEDEFRDLYSRLHGGPYADAEK